MTRQRVLKLLEGALRWRVREPQGGIEPGQAPAIVAVWRGEWRSDLRGSTETRECVGRDETGRFYVGLHIGHRDWPHWGETSYPSLEEAKTAAPRHHMDAEPEHPADGHSHER